MWSLIISGMMSFSMLATNNERTIPVYNINEKAIQHFRHTFTQTSQERWTIGREGYRVSFVSQSVKHVADYHLNGKWRNTIRVYNETHLPENIRHNIKSAFGDSQIVLASEVKLVNDLAYFVKIRQNEWSKTIQVVGDNMDIIEEFRER